MKKILFIGIASIFLFACHKDKEIPGVISRAAVDSADVVTTMATTDYIPVFNDSPKKMSRAYADYVFPWTYLSGNLSPRSTATNVLIGTSTNPNSYDLNIGNTSGFGGNMYLTTTKRLYFGSSSYVTNSGTEIIFYTPGLGIKTLTELADTTGSGGGGDIDLSNVTNNSILFETADTANGSTNFKYIANTLKLTTATGDTGMYILNASTGAARITVNSSSGNGDVMFNLAGGNGWYGANSTSATDVLMTLFNTATANRADALSIANSSHNNYALRIADDNGTNEVFTVTIDSISFYEYAIFNDSSYLFGKGTDLSNTWFCGTGGGATDTAQTENAWQGLEMDLKTPEDYFKDQQEVNGHKELKIWYVDDKTKELKSQYGWAGLSPLETASAHSIFNEILMRYTVDNEKRISNLEAKFENIQTNQPNKFDVSFWGYIVFIGAVCVLCFTFIFILRKKV